MDTQIRPKKAPFDREEYVANFKKTTQKHVGLYEHFKDEATLQQHLKEVEEAQKAGAPF